MSVRGGLVAVGLFSGLVASSSCSRCNPGGAPANELAAAVANASGSADGGGSSRCTTVGAPRVLGAREGEDAAAAEGPAAYGAEVGGAIADAKGFVLGLRGAGLTGAAQVLELPLDGGAPRTLATLPSFPGGARAPLVSVSREGARLVGTLSIGPSARTFHLWRLEEAGQALVPLGEVPQGKDESEVTTFAGAVADPLIAWDDADEALRIGRVRAVLLGKRKPAAGSSEPSPSKSLPKDAAPLLEGEDDVASPPSSDAAWPMLVASPRGDRAVLLWSSERPESDPVDGGEGEPSQAFAFRWIEAVVVDLGTGARLGAPHALTPRDGHAQTFSASWGESGLFLAVRDDPRPTDGDGGALFAVRAAIDASGAIGEPTRIVVADKDVAPGLASLLPRTGGAWVSWLDADGSHHLTPAFLQGSATVEPALRERRVLSSREGRVLASRLVGSGVELSIVRCDL
jgi:hypothetical protein